MWLLQCSYQLNYGKIETRHHCGKQCWTLVMTQWDSCKQDIYHFPWPDLTWCHETTVSSGERYLPGNLVGLTTSRQTRKRRNDFQFEAGCIYEYGTLGLWQTLQTCFGFMTGLTISMIWNIDQPCSQHVTIRIPPNWKHSTSSRGLTVPIKIFDN